MLWVGSQAQEPGRLYRYLNMEVGGHKVLDGGVPDAYDFRVGSDRKIKRGTR